MDAVCANTSGKFELQTQQKFLKKYTRNADKWDRLLLYHQIGSGKTCTAITIAEQWIQDHPDYRVIVILPARLRTNLIDELVSPCGGEKYIDKDTYDRYIDPDTSEYHKKKIRAGFVKKIEEEYTILSFEKWKLLAGRAANLKEWTKDMTTKTLVIVDEVHNLLSNTYDAKKYEEMLTTHKKSNAKGAATMLFKYMTRHASNTCKMIFMTATPIFDNIGQFKELTECLQKTAVPKRSTIADVLPMLKGRVSYFPGTSPVAYPQVSYDMVEVPMSATQDRLTDIVMLENNDDYDDGKEAFMSKQRQIAVSCGRSPLSDMAEYCPKIKYAIDLIIKQKGSKHIVYSSFVKQGIALVAAALEAQGWVNIKDLGYNKDDVPESQQYKVYAMWDGKTRDIEKQKIKALANDRDNRFGKYVRVILGSPSMKEGVSFKHVQHMHILDPVWNVSAKDQVEGRAIRFCSHVDMPAAFRKVAVHLYKAVPKADGEGAVARTCDELIYNVIMPRKEADIRAAEHALRSIALDRDLFKGLYNSSDNTHENTGLHITRSKSVKDKASSCPKRRRPNPILNECPKSFPYTRDNPKGDPCCYKKEARTNKSL